MFPQVTDQIKDALNTTIVNDYGGIDDFTIKSLSWNFAMLNVSQAELIDKNLIIIFFYMKDKSCLVDVICNLAMLFPYQIMSLKICKMV